jgi:uroporphyrinogen decarboxylase
MHPLNQAKGIWHPLTRWELLSVLDGRSVARRVPVMVHFWVNPDVFGTRTQAIRAILARYPCDVQTVSLRMPAVYDAPADHPNYRWLPYDNPTREKVVAKDSVIGIQDWTQLDEILAKWPSPEYPRLFDGAPAADGRYRIGHWWFALFERHWSLRGMTNALMDFYTNPAEVHRLYRALTNFYLRVIERAAAEQHCDGIFTSDDLGTQVGPFFSPDIFREFFKPYYKEMFAKAHSLGMHFWLHSCGNIEPFIDDWIECGLDVLHPIQKHTMDEATIANRYGDRITILCGLDVQQVIPWGTPVEVRAEVRRLLDIFWQPCKGRCLITAGNGITPDCSIESLDAFLDESLKYGSTIVTTGGSR